MTATQYYKSDKPFLGAFYVCEFLLLALRMKRC